VRERQLKTSLAVFIISVNLLIVALVFVCFWAKGFDEDQLTTLLAIIVPMFSCYSVSAIRHIVNERTSKSNLRRVPVALAIVAFGIITFFAGIIFVMIWLQALGDVFSNFEYFKRILLYLETAFAGLIGATIYPMFPSTGEHSRAATQEMVE
jgi:hypothetical protein